MNDEFWQWLAEFQQDGPSQPCNLFEEQASAPENEYGNGFNNSFRLPVEEASPNIASHAPNTSFDSAYGSSLLTEYPTSSTVQATCNLPGNILTSQTSACTTGYTTLSDVPLFPNVQVTPCMLPHAQPTYPVPMTDPLYEHHSPSIPLKRARGNSVSEFFFRESNTVKKSKLSPSFLIGVTAGQETKLCQHQIEWEQADHLPTEAELKALATLARLKPYQVALWFGDRLRISHEAAENNGTSENSAIDPLVLEDIEKDIQKANSRHCANGQSRKVIGGKYKCTWNCGFSTNSRNAWERHEELKQPQKFWYCAACREMQPPGERGNIFIAHRPDKFLPHADSCHSGEDRDQLRARSAVSYVAPFVRQCTFCNHAFINWKERNNHYIRHFEEHKRENDQAAPGDSDEESDEDGKDDDPAYSPSSHGEGNSRRPRFDAKLTGNQSNISSGYSRSSHNTRSYGAHCAVSAQPSGDSRIDESRLQCVKVCKSIDSQQANRDTDLAAKWLIDVGDHRTIEARSEHRYLALNYPGQNKISTKCLEAASARPIPMLPPVHELPSPFQTALHLTKITGFQYLYIDVICGLVQNSGGTNSVNRQASLILAIGPLSRDWSQCWHFFCSYSQISTIQSLGRHGVSFQSLKQLGHGAYSVVDKVQLRPTMSTLARKCVFRTDSKLTLAACWIQEIEIMKKMQHPHITRFVAAYHDQRAFNILMWPVAECDMRQYLSHPERFLQKRQYLSTWFMSLAEAVAYLHNMKCRHKDIKPANILIYGANVLLTDFGTSADFSTSVSTSTGSALMTPKYCAPEVAAKSKRGRCADIFSLGCVFAEMITVYLNKSLEELHEELGMRQGSADRKATYYNHLTKLKRWLKTLMSSPPSAHQQRVLKTTIAMLAKQPSRRPSALAVTKALCRKERCDGLRQGATCHCCPQARSTSTISTAISKAAVNTANPSRFAAREATATACKSKPEAINKSLPPTNPNQH